MGEQVIVILWVDKLLLYSSKKKWINNTEIITNENNDTYLVSSYNDENNNVQFNTVIVANIANQNSSQNQTLKLLDTMSFGG